MMAQAITIITEGRTPSLFHLFIGKLSKFTNWKKLNASNVLTVTDSLRRCKYKKNLANDVHVSRIFLQNYFFFFIFSRSGIVFSSFHVQFFQLHRTKVRNKGEKWKKQRNHFLHFKNYDVIFIPQPKSY